LNIETGQLIRLHIPTRERALWLGPAWAVICGLVASGTFAWRGHDLLFAVLAVLLADGIWATVWWTLVETNWSDVFARWPNVSIDQPVRALPFTQPGSAADRAQHWLSRSIVWFRSELWPQLGSSVLTAIVSIGLGIVLSIIIGWQALALSLAALALIQIALLARRARRGAISIVHGLLDIGLAWTLGHAALNNVSLTSFVIAILFSFAYSGAIEIIQHEKSARRWLIPQLLVIIVLIVLQHPLAAFALIAVLVAQALLSTVLGGHAFARSAQGWLMLAMLIAALAIR
jgi:hypothetical protein